MGHFFLFPFLHGVGHIGCCGFFFLLLVGLLVYKMVSPKTGAQPPYQPPYQPPPPPPPPPPAQANAGAGHFCAQCGAAIQDNTAFCANCGARRT